MCECGNVLGRWRDTTRQLNDTPMFLVCRSSHGFVPRIPLAQAAFCCNRMVCWGVRTLKLLALHLIAEWDWVWFLFAVIEGPKDFGGSHQLLLPIRWGSVIWICKWLLPPHFVSGTLVELIACLSCRCRKCDSSCFPKLCCQVHASWGWCLPYLVVVTMHCMLVSFPHLCGSSSVQLRWHCCQSQPGPLYICCRSASALGIVLFGPKT